MSACCLSIGLRTSALTNLTGSNFTASHHLMGSLFAVLQIRGGCQVKNLTSFATWPQELIEKFWWFGEFHIYWPVGVLYGHLAFKTYLEPWFGGWRIGSTSAFGSVVLSQVRINIPLKTWGKQLNKISVPSTIDILTLLLTIGNKIHVLTALVLALLQQWKVHHVLQVPSVLIFASFHISRETLEDSTCPALMWLLGMIHTVASQSACSVTGHNLRLIS